MNQLFFPVLRVGVVIAAIIIYSMCGGGILGIAAMTTFLFATYAYMTGDFPPSRRGKSPDRNKSVETR